MCYKKGVLGRCANPQCGLLMHYSCVPSISPGQVQQCPVCKDGAQLGAEAVDAEKPYWHEAEVGATNKRRVSKTRPESEAPPFPTTRWPTKLEAAMYGFSDLLDWYVCSRGAGRKTPTMMAQWKAEFAAMEKRQENKAEGETLSLIHI